MSDASPLYSAVAAEEKGSENSARVRLRHPKNGKPTRTRGARPHKRGGRHDHRRLRRSAARTGAADGRPRLHAIADYCADAYCCRDIHANANRDIYAVAHCHADADHHANRNGDIHAIANRNGDTHADANRNADIHAVANRNGDIHADADRHGDTHADANPVAGQTRARGALQCHKRRRLAEQR